MKIVEGNIVDLVNCTIKKGRVLYNERILSIEYDEEIDTENYILPGFVDSHIHIESSMCTPVNYAEIALKHGVVAAVADPHEIANVCGIEGVRYMIHDAKNTPMKIYFGAPSCVPATTFESTGHTITPQHIEELFYNNECSHLSEMMNYPGVINKDSKVLEKIKIAIKYEKPIDGHAPLLSGNNLDKYVSEGITTDHECTSIDEAIEKIKLGMKIMLRKSSASNDFSSLISLIDMYPDMVMLCADDCHPDDLVEGYIDSMVKGAIQSGLNVFNVLRAASLNAVKHYNLNVGLLQQNDPADFIIVNNIADFIILSTYINGNLATCNSTLKPTINPINNYIVNTISPNDLLIERTGNRINLIEVIDNSLLTKRSNVEVSVKNKYIESNVDTDILKIVVQNRYSKAQPSVAFIKGFGLKKGALASSVSHDSHNVVAVGTNDADIAKAINEVNESRGGLALVDGNNTNVLHLPVAGLMSADNCSQVAETYKNLTEKATALGSKLKSPFMTLSFMSLLVIPEIKLGDKGLFDCSKFEFINLQE